jgi:hypothetical protein
MTNQKWNPHHMAVADKALYNISVITDSANGSIAIKNARKWEVTIYNTLGQLLTTKTMASENETINLPYSDLLIIKSEKIIL